MRNWNAWVVMCYFMGLFGLQNLFAQVNSSVNFDGSSNGWTWSSDFSTTTDYNCDATNSIAVNLDGYPNSADIISSAMVTAGGLITFTADYKLINYGDPTDPVTSTDWGNIDYQYSTNDGATWITFGTIDETNHVSSVSCAAMSFTIAAGTLASGTSVKFRINANYNEGDFYVAFDNISVLENATCFAVSNVQISNVTSSQAVVNWTSNNTGSDYEVVYGTQGFTINGAGQVGSISVNNVTTATLPNLTPETVYDVYVRAACSGSTFSLYSAVSAFTTQSLPIALPFNDDFSTSSNWTILNSTNMNKWFIGSAAGNPANSLYISNSPTGATHSYETSTNATVVFAYKPFSIPSGNDSKISFDWINNGETTFDNIQVFVVPVGTTLTPGTLLSTSLPGALSADGELVGSSTWQDKTYTIPSSFAGQDVLIVFQWKNDGGGGSQVPGGIDNVSVFQETCPSPLAVTVAPLGTSATVTWNTGNAPASGWDVAWGPVGFAPNDANQIGLVNVSGTSHTIPSLTPLTSYAVFVRGNCGAGLEGNWSQVVNFSTSSDPVNLPFSDDFSTTSNWQLINGSQTNTWHIGAAAGNPANGLYISEDASGALNEYDNGSTSVVFATKLFNIPTGNPTKMMFDWRNLGEVGYDRIRVFALPVTTEVTAGVELAESPTTHLSVTELSNSSTWQNAVYTIPATYAGQVVRIVFQWRNDGGSGSNPPAGIDNVNIFQESCAMVENVAVVAQTTSATVTWTVPVAPAQGFEIVWGPQGFTPGSASQLGQALETNTSYVISGLVSNTLYSVYVRSICDPSNMSMWSSVAHFNTQQVAVDVPFTDDFSTGSNWLFVNGSEENKWHIGAVAGNPANAMYISNDNGTTHAYSTGSSSVVFATKLVNIPAGNPTKIKFDWINNGEEGYDRIRVYALPVSTVLTPGDELGESITGYLGSTELSLTTTWQNINYYIPVDYLGQTVKIVFEWRNDGSGGDQVPGGIDNVEIYQEDCATPLNVTVLPSATSATVEWFSSDVPALGWTVVWGPEGFTPGGTNQIGSLSVTDSTAIITGLSDNTTYQVYIQANCDTDGLSDWSNVVTFSTTCLPIQALGYCNSFENESDINCWTIINANNDWVEWTLGSDDEVANTGDGFMYIDTDYNDGDNDDYLVMPKMILTGNEVLSFFYKVISEYEPNDLKVLISTTDMNPASFTELLDLPYIDNEEYQDTSINLSAYTGEVYIAFQVAQGGLDGWELYIDDVCIDICTPLTSQDGEADVCVSEQTIDLDTVITSVYTHGNWEFSQNQSLVNGSIFNFSSLQDGDYTLQYIVPGACTNDTTVAVIRVRTSSNAGDNVVLNACRNQTIQLDTLLASNSPTGGVFLDGNGSVMTSTVITTPAFMGQFVYKYVVVSGVCEPDTASITVNVGTCDAVGIDGVASIEGVSISPNPTSGLFQIHGIASEGVYVEIIDVTGKVIVASNKVQAAQNVIDLSQVENGVYLVQVSNGNSNKIIRVVKQN